MKANENSERVTSEQAMREQEEYINQLNMINDLPDLLLGGESQTMANGLVNENIDKKIICDFDDFEDEGNLFSQLPLAEPPDKSPREGRYKPINPAM